MNCYKFFGYFLQGEMSQWQQNCLIYELFSLHIYNHFSTWTWVSRYQNVSTLDLVGAKDDGGGGESWSCKTCKAPVKSSPPTNQYLAFYRPDVLPVTQPTVSKHWRKNRTMTDELQICYSTIAHHLSPCGLWNSFGVTQIWGHSR